MDIPRPARVAATTAALLALTGCGTGEAGDAQEVVRRFEEAVSRQDGATACSLLSPAARSRVARSAGKPCSAGVTHEVRPGGPPGTVAYDVEVFGDQAIAHDAGHAVFLARFEDGWRVTNAGCTLGAHQLYSCTLEGS